MLTRHLSFLVALAREGHFGRAAAACHVSQPSLSAAIRALEDELGVLLVERGRRFHGLTPEGRRVLAWAQRILAECDGMTQDIASLKTGLSGQLRLGVIPSAMPAVGFLTGPFAAAHPLLLVTIWSQTSLYIQRGLDEYQIDLGITYLDNEPVQRARTAPLYRETYCLLTQENGPFAGRDSVTWGEAATQPLCLLTPDMQNRRIIDATLRGQSSKPQILAESNSMLALASHVTAGGCATILPRAFADLAGIPAGTVALPLVMPDISHVVGLVAPDRDPLPPVTRALMGYAATQGIGGRFASV